MAPWIMANKFKYNHKNTPPKYKGTCRYDSINSMPTKFVAVKKAHNKNLQKTGWITKNNKVRINFFCITAEVNTNKFCQHK